MTIQFKKENKLLTLLWSHSDLWSYVDTNQGYVIKKDHIISNFLYMLKEIQSQLHIIYSSLDAWTAIAYSGARIK
jgi:hypothetical protein